MTKLNDTQTILLSGASQRDSGSLYPLSEGRSAGPRITRAIAALLTAGFIAERETDDIAAISRNDGDLCYGLYITDAGLSAIGVESETEKAERGEASADAPEPVPAAPRQTKAGLVLCLLQRNEGATLAELIAATGWLPHTTRAALTGLRKKGHGIERTRRDDATCYRIESVA